MLSVRFISVLLFLHILLALAPLANKQTTAQTPNSRGHSIEQTYSCVFKLITQFEDKSFFRKKDSRDFWRSYFRNEMNFSVEQDQHLKVVALEFVTDYFSTEEKNRTVVFEQYRERLRALLGAASFDRFDEYLNTTIAPRIIVAKTGDSFAFFGFALISLNSISLELRGIAGIGFNDDIASTNFLECSVSATMTGSNVSESGSDAADCNERLPFVELISTSWIGNSQYCINANYVIDGQSSNRMDCVTSPPATPRVTSLVFEQYQNDDLPIDINPNTGGGQRLFADDKVPNDSVDRRKIKVKATISEQQAGLRVYFINYDLDDPSTDDKPIDPNSNAGFDNKGLVDDAPNTEAGLLSIPSGTPDCEVYDIGMSCLTNSLGEVFVDFTLTRQPGDNFTVAASTNAVYAGELSVDGINIVDKSNTQIPATTSVNECVTSSIDACRTDMLTVWRRLHLEVDSMKDVQGNFVEGTFFSDKKIGNSETLVFFNLSEEMEFGRFNGGRLVTGNGSRRKVLKIVSNNFNSAMLRPMTDGRPVNIYKGDQFTIYDDDDFDDSEIHSLNGDTGDEIPKPDMRLLSNSDSVALNALAPAYVRPVYDIKNSRDNNTFTVNVPDGECPQTIRSLFGDYDSNSTNTDEEFWSVYILGAYQAEVLHDKDGSFDLSRTDGLVDWITGDTPRPGCPDTEATGAAIFLEVNRIKENPNYSPDISSPHSMAVTVVHEIGHLLSCKHGEGEIMGMSSDNGLPVSNKFSDVSLDKIRRVMHP